MEKNKKIDWNFDIEETEKQKLDNNDWINIDKWKSYYNSGKIVIDRDSITYYNYNYLSWVIGCDLSDIVK